jgi:hypothetical protein
VSYIYFFTIKHFYFHISIVRFYRGKLYCTTRANTMDSILQSIGTTVLEYHNHKVVIADWSLVGPILKKWSRNRDADELRVQEIANHILSGGFVPPILHVADLDSEGLVCYDGNHRRSAFMKVPLPPDFKVVLDILCKATQRGVFECFENINKSVQVPAIYTDDTSSTSVKQDILSVVQQFEKQYKAFVSTSNRPNAPNFNRDILIETLYNFWKDHQGTYSVKDIQEALKILNTLYDTRKIDPGINRIRSSTLRKCQQHHFWIFKDRLLNTEHLQNVLENKYSKESGNYHFY